jgi:DNA repair exonuclease SbcCD ATPase subunit
MFKRLLVKNYRKFIKKEVFFETGINVILGNNETGKSTISRAILDALYTDPTTQSKTILTKINSWGESSPAYLELELEDDGVGYLLTKDFGKKESKFVNLDTEKETSNLEEINLILNKLTGLPSKEIYQNTAYITQSDIAQIETNRDFINAIQNIANESDVDVNVQNIIFQLENELKRMRLGIDRHANEPGPIKSAQEKINQLKLEIKEKTQLVHKSNEVAKMGETADTELQTINKKIKEIEALLGNYSTLESANEKLKQLEKQYKEIETTIQNYNDLVNEKKRVTAELTPYSQFINKDLEALMLKLNNSIEKRKIANAELTRLSVVEENESKTRNGFMLEYAYYIVVFILSAVVYALLQNIVVASLIFIFGFVIVSLLLFQKKNSESYSIKKQEDLINQNLNQWKFRVQQGTEEIQRILDEYRCEDVSGFYTSKAKFSVLNENLKEINANINGLLSNNSIEVIKQKQVDLLTQKKEIEINQLTDIVKSAKITPQEYLSNSRELDSLLDKKKILENQSTTAKVRQEDIEVDGDTINKLEEELEFNEKILENNLHKQAVFQTTLNTIQESIKLTARTVNQIIEGEIEKYLPKITNNRYSKIKLNDKFEILVYSDEKSDWVEPIENLSKGTVDQIYFLTRLGFLRGLLKDKATPIICDDTFVSFDPERKSALQDVLDKSSDNNQILLFTCNPEYADWGATSYLE